MFEQLPETIKPQSLFDTGGYVGGITALAQMKRLAAVLVDHDGTAETQLEFGKDAQGIRYVRGSIKTELSLTCQRCLKGMRYPVEIELSLALVTSDAQAESLPDSYEAMLYDTKTMSLVALVEDELLLALPLVAVHVDEGCNDNVMNKNTSDHLEVEMLVEETPRPFAALAKLKE